MATVPGKRIRPSLPRRWIIDLMRISRDIPLIVFERRMDLARLAEARKQYKVGWSMLFAKAYGLVAERYPELRRAYMSLPFAHFFEAERSIGTIAIEREYKGERAVFFIGLHDPAKRPLTELQQLLTEWQTRPVEEIREFRRLIRYSRLPGLLRRLIWWYGFNILGRVRAYNFGTFGISITAGSGATGLRLLSPVATTINYGPFDDLHRLDVRLHFDHRVIDGMTAARVLAALEETLNGPIADELRSIRKELD